MCVNRDTDMSFSSTGEYLMNNCRASARTTCQIATRGSAIWQSCTVRLFHCGFLTVGSPNRAVRDDRHLHIPSEVHHLLHESLTEPRSDDALPLSCHEDLRHAMEASEAHDGFGDVGPLNDPCFDLESTREIEVAL
jgi:hypothetical protein